MSKHKDRFDQNATDTLDKQGTYIEPDVRQKLKKYFKAMGLTKDKKIQIKVSELRQLVRDVLNEDPGTMGRMSMMNTADDNDYDKNKTYQYVCDRCGHNSTKTYTKERVEMHPTQACEKTNCDGMGQAKLINENQILPEDETLEEFADWASDFQQTFNDKRYELMARQIYDDWPEHDEDVDWSKVLDIYVRNKAKNLHVEIDKNKLYEKLLSYVETHYDGNVPPTTGTSHPQYGTS